MLEERRSGRFQRGRLASSHQTSSPKTSQAAQGMRLFPSIACSYRTCSCTPSYHISTHSINCALVTKKSFQPRKPNAAERRRQIAARQNRAPQDAVSGFVRPCHLPSLPHLAHPFLAVAAASRPPDSSSVPTAPRPRNPGTQPHLASTPLHSDARRDPPTSPPLLVVPSPLPTPRRARDASHSPPTLSRAHASPAGNAVRSIPSV